MAKQTGSATRPARDTRARRASEQPASLKGTVAPEGFRLLPVQEEAFNDVERLLGEAAALARLPEGAQLERTGRGWLVRIPVPGAIKKLHGDAESIAAAVAGAE